MGRSPWHHKESGTTERVTLTIEHEEISFRSSLLVVGHHPGGWGMSCHLVLLTSNVTVIFVSCHRHYFRLFS